MENPQTACGRKPDANNAAPNAKHRDRSRNHANSRWEATAALVFCGETQQRASRPPQDQGAISGLVTLTRRTVWPASNYRSLALSVR